MRPSIAFALLFPALLSAADAPALPAAWHGEWVGELVVFLPDGKTTQVPLTLVVRPVDKSAALTWKATYGGAKPVVKDYKLVPGDKPGRFRIDEGGGLVLDARLDGDVLVSAFAVGETVLTARYELRDGKLRQEVTSAKKVGDKMPAGVQGYEVVSVQRAVLARKE